jgi:hypothetical protein
MKVHLKMSKQSIDQRALKILSSTYWSSSGWKKSYSTPPEDFAYAKASGFMFDSTVLSHDEKIAWVLRSRSRVSKTSVANGFLASLTSRRLDRRSALGSFAVSLHMPTHSWLRGSGSFCCSFCGGYDRSNVVEDLNILNFERFKWGGVRHTNPLYIAFDLEQFSIAPPDQPTEDDLALMQSVLDGARSLSRSAKLSHLVKALADIVPSNDAERRTLIAILGFCGILQDPSKPGFLNGFPPHCIREEVPWTKNDWPYPIQWWNGSFGVTEEAVAFWFPGL